MSGGREFRVGGVVFAINCALNPAWLGADRQAKQGAGGREGECLPVRASGPLKLDAHDCGDDAPTQEPPLLSCKYVGVMKYFWIEARPRVTWLSVD